MGRAAFDSESAQPLAAAGKPVILMRPDTSTADVAGFAVAAGPPMRRWSRGSDCALRGSSKLRPPCRPKPPRIDLDQ